MKKNIGLSNYLVSIKGGDLSNYEQFFTKSLSDDMVYPYDKGERFIKLKIEDEHIIKDDLLIICFIELGVRTYPSENLVDIKTYHEIKNTRKADTVEPTIV